MKRVLTAAEARAILSAAKETGLSGQARINKVLSRQQAYHILWDGIADLTGAQYVEPLISRHIQREFGP